MDMLNSFASVMMALFGDVMKSWYVIVLVSCFGGLIIGFMWLTILQFFAGIIVWGTIFALFLLCCAFTFYCYLKGGLLGTVNSAVLFIIII